MSSHFHVIHSLSITSLCTEHAGMNRLIRARGLTLLWPPAITSRVRIPLYAEPCAAGFPSPAQDYVEKELDLNELCIRRRASTFFVRPSGNSMEEL